jgi:hypothetical protein
MEKWIAIDTKSSNIRGELGLPAGGWVYPSKGDCIEFIVSKHPYVVASGEDPDCWSIRPMRVLDPSEDMARPVEAMRKIIDLVIDCSGKSGREGIGHDEAADLARLFFKDVEQLAREYTRPGLKLLSGD